MTKINIEETTDDHEEMEIPGAGQWEAPHDKVEAAFDMLEDKYKLMVDDDFLDAFCAGLFFVAVPKDADVFGDSVEDYFANALRNINKSKTLKLSVSDMLASMLG